MDNSSPITSSVASARPPTPPQGTGCLDFRVYGVTPTGQRYQLPPDVDPVPGRCVVPSCDCGGPECVTE